MLRAKSCYTKHVLFNTTCYKLNYMLRPTEYLAMFVLLVERFLLAVCGVIVIWLPDIILGGSHACANSASKKQCYFAYVATSRLRGILFCESIGSVFWLEAIPFSGILHVSSMVPRGNFEDS